MALNPQQRSLAILGGVFGGGLLIAFLAVSLISGDDPKDRRVAIDPDQPSTSTSTTTLTLPPTLPTTLATIPVPPNPPVTPGTITPGTVIVTPTSPPATTGTTGAPPSTTPTTNAPTAAEQLQAVLEDALLGGEEPDPDADPRVRVVHDEEDNEVRVSWDLDATLDEDEQKYAAREEATVLLRAIKEFSGFDDEVIVVRAFLPDPDPPPPRMRVVRLEFERATLDAIDFDTVDPLTIFELADEKDIDSSLEPAPPPTTSTSSTTTTT
jgi:hypothetical protein